MKIRIIKIENADKGKYQLLTVTYRNLETNKVLSTKVPSFNAPDVFNTLKDSKSDDVFDIKSEQDGKFWNWVSATPAEAPAPTQESTAPSTARKGTSYERQWEDREERALKQILIVRQSSVSNAAPYSKTIDEVLVNAAKIEAWVFRQLSTAGEEPLDVAKAMAEILAMKDDVPN